MLNMNARFAEQCQVVPFVIPVDLNAGANAGDWVSMKNFERLTVMVLAGAGSASNDLTITVNQATDVSGTGSKVANVITEVAQKQGTLNAIGQYTEVTQAADEQYTDAASGENQNLIIFDILAEDLDAANDFDCVQVTLNQVGAAKVGTAIGILWGAKYAGGVEDLPSAIAN